MKWVDKRRHAEIAGQSFSHLSMSFDKADVLRGAIEIVQPCPPTPSIRSPGMLVLVVAGRGVKRGDKKPSGCSQAKLVPQPLTDSALEYPTTAPYLTSSLPASAACLSVVSSVRSSCTDDGLLHI